jgi:sulfite exporter TauE/SafE
LLTPVATMVTVSRRVVPAGSPASPAASLLVFPALTAAGLVASSVTAAAVKANSRKRADTIACLN